MRGVFNDAYTFFLSILFIKAYALGKHAYSNTCILKISPQKTASFQIKI